jgi:urease alpha subunit
MKDRPAHATIRRALLAAKDVIQHDRAILLRSHSDAMGRVDGDARYWLEQYDKALTKIHAALKASRTITHTDPT